MRNNPAAPDVARSVMTLFAHSQSSQDHGSPWPASRAHAPASLFCPGRNCRETVRAARAAVLVDGAEYFRHLESSLRQARRSIIIVGWDFDGRIRLRPQAEDSESPPLGALLRELVEAKPQLAVQILIWSVSVVHAPSAIAPALFGSDWEDHPRIQVKLDTRHPIYASHHQKIVCIDGAIAFVGGIDLTVRRWDTSDHRADDPRRIDCDGQRYPPVHDIQMVFDGAAAAAMCAMAAERWRSATGELPAAGLDMAAEVGDEVAGAPWPDGLRPDFRNVTVAVARTEPAYDGRSEICEGSALALDMIAAARRSVYIEAQYLTAKVIAAALSRRLEAPEGPDIVVVMTRESRGFLERLVMSGNRDRLIRRLVRADRFGRLRMLYPVVPGAAKEVEVLVHAKLIVVDDRLIRIGSSNLNNRSIGLDTECDVAIESGGAADRAAIAGIRNRLLAEHLDCSAEDVGAAIADDGLAGAIDRLNRKPRGLRSFRARAGKGPFRPVLGTRVLDPERVFRLPWPFG